MAAATPISLGYIAANAKKNGHEAKVLSLGSTTLFSQTCFRDFINEYSPELVGLGTYQRNIFQVHALAQIVKDTVPDVSIVLGGPQITFLPDVALSVEDCLVRVVV